MDREYSDHVILFLVNDCHSDVSPVNNSDSIGFVVWWLISGVISEINVG